MNVFCCVSEDHLLLGIPSTKSWSLKATPCESESKLTLQIDCETDIPLLKGCPINLSKLTLEIKDISAVCNDTDRKSVV